MIDADAGTLVLRGGGVPGQREWLTTRVEALAYRLKPDVSALVIGPGGGAEVAMELAFRDYLDRLTPDGVISFTRWHVEPPDQILRLVAIARTAMAERGIGDPGRH